jgi:NADPH:quinone reductase and related Zn-dependent oxidoreductases
MKAAVIHAHGGPENLVVEPDWPTPRPGSGDVVVRVRASSLNYHDIFTRRGMPGITLNLPVVPGLDLAGEIAAIGPDVEGWAVGDRVLVDPRNRVEGGLQGETFDGGLAEYAKARAHQVIRLPESVSFAQAAALPVAYATTHRMLATIGKVAAGEKVLVLGASGGVGTAAVLLAKLAGAEVTACASSPEKLERLKALGADHLINYAETDFVKEIHRLYGKPHRRTHEGGVDVVVNFTGGDTWVKSFRVLRRRGRLLTCGATAGHAPQTDLRYVWSFELQVLGSNSWEREDLDALLDLVAAGRLDPLIDRAFPLDESREALRLIEDRSVIGKVIVEP